MRRLAANLSVLLLCSCSEPAAPTLAKERPEAAEPGGPSPAKPTLARDAISDAGVRQLESPAPAGSQFGDIHSRADGALVLSWVEPQPPAPDATEGGGRVRFSVRLPDQPWSEPLTAADDADMLINWADVPRVFTFGANAVLATWPRRQSEGYTLMARVSNDGGGTFGDPFEVPSDTHGPEYGFPSFVRRGDDVVVFWLDGRATGGHDSDPSAEPGHHASAGAMQLRSARIDSTGDVHDRRVIDRRVCDCCQTDAAVGTRDRGFVVFRDRGPTEVRDIHIAELGAPRGRAVHDDAWEIAGCPVNGPAIASDAGDLAVAWFTGVEPPGSVHLAFERGRDTGSFGEPIRMDGGAPLGRVDVLRFGEHAVVSWLESQPDSGDAAILLRAASPSGAQPEAHRMGTVAADRSTGFPRLGALGDDLVVAYTADRVRLAAFRP